MALSKVGGNQIDTVSGDLTVDTNTLKVDAANNRVGVGTVSPSEPFHIVGASGAATDMQIQGGDDTNSVRLFMGGNTNPVHGRIIYSTASDFMAFSTGGDQRVRVDSDGLKFGTDSAAANALDDYEQGTWTPSVGGSATYTTQAGHYIKIGDMVFITGNLTINNISGADHTNYLDGLPYASVTGAGREGHISVQYFANLASSGTYFALRTNGDRLYGSAQRENDNTMVVNVDIFQSSTEVAFGGSYFVA